MYVCVNRDTYVHMQIHYKHTSINISVVIYTVDVILWNALVIMWQYRYCFHVILSIVNYKVGSNSYMERISF